MFMILVVNAPVAGAADLPGRNQEATPGTEASDWLPFPALDTQEGISLYKDMYALPLTWSEDYHGRETEVIFRLSAKVRLSRTRFFLGYTQLSLWQAYNKPESSPFRETNYNPELFYRIAPSNSSLENWGADLGYEHESNGRGGEDSRSWDRIYAAAHYQNREFLFYVKVWYRLDEDECPIGDDGLELEQCRDDPSFDDNPDITDYMGYGESHFRYRWTGLGKPQRIHFMVRGNPATGKGGIGFDYSHPTGTKSMHYFLKVWHGYGESLVDYNRSITRIGVGVLLRR